MAFSVAAQPPAPASCYGRPLQYQVQRTDPTPNLVEEVFIADASDVSTLGNGLQEGDVVVYYTTTVGGSIPVAEGQTILLDEDMGDYAGVHEVTNAFTVGADKYAVIDAQDQGDFTPGGGVGAMRVWLNNYTVYCKVLVYTTPGGDPQEVVLHKLAGADGLVSFNADLVIKDYFSHRIDTYVEPDIGGGICQTAHGVTALFYRTHITDQYDVPGEDPITDPFSGGNPVTIGTLKVAVRAVHPYSGTLIDRTDADFSQFVPGTTGTRNFLTNAPRVQRDTLRPIVIELGTNDRFQLFMLTDEGETYDVDYTLRVFNMDSGSAVFMEAIPVELDGSHAAFSVACGPLDLADHLTVPGLYRAFLSNADTNILSEYIEVRVDTKCRENARKFGFVNPLGGVDLYSFRGRENAFTEGQRATVRKPYDLGDGFDWQERTYRNDPSERVIVSTAPLPMAVRQWLARDMARSSNVVTLQDGMVAPVTMLTKDLQHFSSGPHYKPLTIEYRLGVEQVAQQN